MAVIASSGNITIGTCIAMGGLMLAQFEEPESDIKMTADEGSWFGKKNDNQNLLHFTRYPSYSVNYLTL